jgi:hypothetical protein
MAVILDWAERKGYNLANYSCQHTLRRKRKQGGRLSGDDDVEGATASRPLDS